METELQDIFLRIFELDIIPENFKKNNNEDIWDSIKHLMLVVEIESYYKISLSPEEIQSIESLEAAIEIIQKKNHGTRE